VSEWLPKYGVSDAPNFELAALTGPQLPFTWWTGCPAFSHPLMPASMTDTSP